MSYWVVSSRSATAAKLSFHTIYYIVWNESLAAVSLLDGNIGADPHPPRPLSMCGMSRAGVCGMCRLPVNMRNLVFGEQPKGKTDDF